MYHTTYRSFYLREFRGTYETHMGVNLIIIINVTLLILPCGDDAEDVLKKIVRAHHLRFARIFSTMKIAFNGLALHLFYTLQNGFEPIIVYKYVVLKKMNFV